MRPEAIATATAAAAAAAAEAQEERGRVYDCPAEGPRRPPPLRGPESPTLWRPWIPIPQDAEQTRSGGQLEPGSDRQASRSKGAFGFQHPVRLYLPISKRQEYLHSAGEKVLASFPVQATIHFYNDLSDSEDGEQLEDPRLLPQAGELAEMGPGGHSDSPGGAQCSSSKYQ